MSKCLIDGCGKEVKARGLCPACYATAIVKVQAGKVTWDELAALGLALPSKGRGRIPGGNSFSKALAKARASKPAPDPAAAPLATGDPGAGLPPFTGPIVAPGMSLPAELITSPAMGTRPVAAAPPGCFPVPAGAITQPPPWAR